MDTRSDKTNWNKPVGDYFEALTPNKQVTIYVGPNKHVWVMPKDLLCDRVEYFRAAFKGGFQESATRKLWLEEDDPDAWTVLVSAIISGNFPQIITFRGPDIHLLACKIWVLADKLGIERMRDPVLIYLKYDHGIMESIKDNARIIPELTAEAINYAYTHTTDSSPLRHALVDHAVLRFFDARLDDAASSRLHETMSTDADFNMDVLRSIRLHNELDESDCTMHGRKYVCTRHAPFHVLRDLKIKRANALKASTGQTT